MNAVSVVIPTRSRQSELAACLTSLFRSGIDGLTEVVIVDDASSPSTRIDSPVPTGVAVVLLRNRVQQGAAASRNRGVTAASGKIVAFLDDDARVVPGWLNIVRRELTPARGAVTGPVIGFDETLCARARQRRYEERYRGLATGGSVPFMAGGNSAVWRHLFLALGGFVHRKAGADNDFVGKLNRVGLHCHFVADMVIRHRNDKGLLLASLQAFRAGGTRAESNAFRIRSEVASVLNGIRGPGPETTLRLVNSYLQFCFLAGSVWCCCRPRMRSANRNGQPAPRGGQFPDP